MIETQYTRIFDFSGGMRNAEENPLSFPENALLDGNNVEIRGKALVTRWDTELWTSNPTLESDSRGPCIWLKQVYFPTNQQSYLLGYWPDFGLSVCPTPLPIVGRDNLEWFDHTVAAPSYCLPSSTVGDWNHGGMACAVINDRAILTRIGGGLPYVFCGGTAEDGADWAKPLYVLGEGQADGTDIFDMSVEALDQDWDSSAGIFQTTAATIYVGCDVPNCHGIYYKIATTGTITDTTVEAYIDGTWTEVSTVTLESDGINTGNLALFSEEATIGLVAQLTAYWFRIVLEFASAEDVSIYNVRFRGVCDPLQNLSSAIEAPALACLYYQAATGSTVDMTIDVSDYTRPTYKFLNDGGRITKVPMGTADFLYIGYSTPFVGILLDFVDNKNNQETASITVEVWDGSDWIECKSDATPPVHLWTDNTSVSNKAFNQSGSILFSVPEDSYWAQYRPIGGYYPMAYYCRLSVSATISEEVGIAELRVYPSEEALGSHSLCGLKRDRVVLCNTPDAPDRIEISSTLQEFGWTGPDTWSARIGGPIIAYAEVFNQPFVWTPTEMWLLNGYSPQTFSLERAECAGIVPCSQESVVVAPITENTGLNKMGIYMVNAQGAWSFSGLQIYSISDSVSWWSDKGYPRIEKSLLYGCCGVYWSEKNWLVWSVPMAVADDDEPNANSHLIVYDLGLKAWLPPMEMYGVYSMTVARAYNEDAPGYLGKPLLLAGNYDAGIGQLFATENYSPDGGVVSWVSTGWLSFGQPGLEKHIRTVELYGDSGPVTMEIYVNGSETAAATYTFSNLYAMEGMVFDLEEQSANVMGQFFRFKLSWTGVIFGMEIGWQLRRVRQPQGVTT